MADRVEVIFGGDTTELDAAAARADAALKKLNDSVRAQTGQTRTLDATTQSLIGRYVEGAAALNRGQYAFQGISEAVQAGTLSTGLAAKAYAGLAVDLEKSTEKAFSLGISVSEATRGVRALGDEIASGRYRQASGTFGRLFGMFAESNPVIAAATAGILAFAGGLAYTVYEAIETNKALDDVRDRLNLLGRGQDFNEEATRKAIESMREFGNVSQSSAREAVVAFSSIHGVTDEERKKLYELLPGFAQLTGNVEGGKGAVEELSKAFDGGVGSLQKFAEKYGLLNEQETLEMERAKLTNNEFEARETILTALSGRLSTYIGWLKDVAKQESMTIALGGANSQDTTEWYLGGAKTGTKNPPPVVTGGTTGQDAANASLIDQYNRQAVAIKAASDALARLTALSKEANISDEERARRLEAVREAQNQLDALTAKKSTSEKDAAKAAKEAAAERLAQLQAEVAEAKEGSAQRVEAARKEVTEVARLYGTSSKEYIAAQHALTMATKEEASQRAKAQVELDEARRQAALGEIEIKREVLSEQRSMGQISADQERAALKKLEDDKFQIELAGLRQRLALEDLTVVEKAKINTQIEQLEQKHQLVMTKIADKAVQDQKARWLSYLQPINSAIQTSINGMIMGTTTLRGVVANLGQSVIAEFVSMGVKSAEEWIATHLAMKAASATTGVAEVASNAAVAGSAAYASTAAIPIVGPELAPAAAATAYAGAMSYGAMASAAGGWGQIPSDQIAQVHKDEMILPADIAGPVRDMAARGGGGGDIHLHVNAIDAKSFAEVLGQHDGPIHKAVKKARRSFQESRFARQ